MSAFAGLTLFTGSLLSGFLGFFNLRHPTGFGGVVTVSKARVPQPSGTPERVSDGKFWLVNLASALTGMRLGTFAAATAIGIIPGTFAFAFLGQGLDSVISAEAKTYGDCVLAQGPENCHVGLSVQSLVTTEMLVAFAALGLVALIPVGLKTWKGNE